MNKDFWKIAYRFLILMVPFFVFMPLYCAHFQPYYMDGEYAMYRAQRDYVDLGETESTYNEIIVLGDSRTKAAINPSDFSKQMYNLSLGGTTMIEGYYTLCDYLNNHEKPKTVLINYAPFHYMDVDMFWKRSVYFHYLKKDQILEVFETAKTFEHTEDILTEQYLSDFYAYQYYMPNKYGGALKNSCFVMRKKINDQNYEQVSKDRGHHYFGLLAGSDGINWEAKVPDFVYHDVILHYFEKTIALCKEQGIQVIVETTPVNETSYGIFTESFKSHYRAYMNGVASRHPEARIYTDFYVYPNAYFGDADHLNPDGSKEYARFLQEKYKEVFTK